MRRRPQDDENLKFQAPNSNQISVQKEQNGKPYDLEARTELFARRVRTFLRVLRPSELDIDDARQLLRASGSVGANDLEANDSLGKKDILLRARIARREAKESRYWLRLIVTRTDSDLERERFALIQEADELIRILSPIIRKSE